MSAPKGPFKYYIIKILTPRTQSVQGALYVFATFIPFKTRKAAKTYGTPCNQRLLVRYTNFMLNVITYVLIT